MEWSDPGPEDVGPMAISSEIVPGGVLRIRVSGALELAGRDRLRAAFLAALDARPEAIVVDLTEVGFCDTTGIEALVRLDIGGRERDVPVRMRPSKSLARVLELSGLCEVLDLVPVTPGVVVSGKQG